MIYMAFVATLLVNMVVPIAVVYGESFEVVLARVPDEYVKLRGKVEQSLKSFRSRESALILDFQKDLLTHESAILSSQGETIGEKTLSQVRELKSWLDGYGDMPKCDLLTQPVIAYATKLYQARTKMDVPLRALITKLSRDRKKDLVDSLDNAYHKLGRILDARDSIKKDVVFLGARQEVGSDHTTPLRIRFDTVASNGHFSGTVERGYMFAGHPRHEFVGSVEGLKLHGETRASLANPGSKQDLGYVYSGLVIGRALVGNYAGTDDKNKVKQGTFYLTR